MATVDAHGYDFSCMTVSILTVVQVSYWRGGLWLLVLTNWAIPTASESGASNWYRLRAFLYIRFTNLNRSTTKSESL